METPQATEVQPIAAETCSKCSNDLDTTGSPKWCKRCRRKYQQEYQETRREMDCQQAFGRGVDDARAVLGAEFSRIGRAQLSGREIAFAILNSPRPPYRA